MAARTKTEDRQAALLLRALLACEDGGAFQKDLSPEPSPKLRQPLEDEGLIRISKKNRSNWIELTEKGREHAQLLPPPEVTATAKGTSKGTRTSEDAEREKEALVLLGLIACEEGAAWQHELSPQPTPKLRAALQAKGLIHITKKGRSNWIEATDKGWHWAGTHLSELLPETASGAAGVLRQWLARLDTFVKVKGLVLADVMAPVETVAVSAAPLASATNAAPAVPVGDLPARIRSAYLAVTGGRLATRVLLRDIRARLPDVPREALDDMLKRMQRDQVALLYRLDNSLELTAADHAAALHIAGEPRHILWIKA